MVEACSRCGEEREGVGACPSCGFVPEHPGVLGSYVRAFGALVSNPALFVVFLVPVAVLGLVVWVSQDVGEPVAVTVGGVVGSVVALFVVVAWYLVAVGVAARVTSRDVAWAWPSGGLVRGALAGAGAVVAPVALFMAVWVVQPSGALEAFALVGSVLLVIGAFFVMGRAVGMPVEGALAERSLGGVVALGSRRGRENGGLGLVFLGVLVLALVPLGLGVLGGVWGVRLEGFALSAFWGFALWLLGAWVGCAWAVGLVGRLEADSSMVCPRCGREAVVRGGRASCACGLEGPVYEGDPASRG